MILRIATIICLLLSVIWLICAPDWEPAISCVALTATLIGEFTIGLLPSHPHGQDQNRGPLVRCRFNIDPTWATRKGWQTYADVLVEFLDSVPTDKNVFLIPSALARPELRNTNTLRKINGDDSPHLALKREATEAFLRQLKPRPLRGYRFTIGTEEGQKYKVYSAAYDRFLNKYASHALSDPRGQ